MSDVITWTCSICDAAVEDGEGYVSISILEADHAFEAMSDWEAKHQRSMTYEEIASAPPHARWLVFHSSCDPAPEEESYPIDVERVRTPWDLLAWTHHLMGKPWIAGTDWISLIGQIARDHGAGPL